MTITTYLDCNTMRHGPAEHSALEAVQRFAYGEVLAMTSYRWTRLSLGATSRVSVGREHSADCDGKPDWLALTPAAATSHTRYSTGLERDKNGPSIKCCPRKWRGWTMVHVNAR